MTSKTIREKDELYWAVLNSAVTLDMRHGHLKWKVSDLARVSRVSRPLIYYYFGKSKEAILSEAVRLFGDDLSGSSPKHQALWREGQFKEALERNRELLTKIPAIVPFYYLNRGAKSEMGEAIRTRESAFFKKIETFFPQLTKSDAQGVFALFFGLLFVPNMPEADALRGIELLLMNSVPKAT